MTATATSIVNELTDKAIIKRVDQIDRLVSTREKRIFDTQNEIDEFVAERAGLVGIQIERLRAQLPKEQA